MSDDVECTLCNASIPDWCFETGGLDAEAFGNARDKTSDELWVVVRCRKCVSTTVICDGGDA